MPWTPKQKRYLLSDVSPLTDDQKEKMLDELHADPSLGHAKKGYTKPAARPAPKPAVSNDAEGYAYNWRNHQGRPKKAPK